MARRLRPDTFSRRRRRSAALHGKSGPRRRARAPDAHRTARAAAGSAPLAWVVNQSVRSAAKWSVTRSTPPQHGHHDHPGIAEYDSPDGRTLATGSGNGTTQLWNLNVGQAIDRICATTSDDLTPQQWALHPPTAL